MLTKVVDRAVGVLTLAAGAARHVAWYVSYHVHGNARDGDSPAETERPSR